MNVLSKFLTKYLPRECFNRSVCICYAKNCIDFICLYSYNPFNKLILISDVYCTNYRFISLKDFIYYQFNIITDLDEAANLVSIYYTDDLPF